MLPSLGGKKKETERAALNKQQLVFSVGQFQFLVKLRETDPSYEKEGVRADLGRAHGSVAEHMLSTVKVPGPVSIYGTSWADTQKGYSLTLEPETSMCMCG